MKNGETSVQNGKNPQSTCSTALQNGASLVMHYQLANQDETFAHKSVKTHLLKALQ